MNKYVTWFKDNKGTVLIVVLLFLVALSTRVTDLGTFLTADEKNWIGRSYEFVKAFKDWRFNEMLQTTHPGVTTLWLSGVAVTVKMLTSHIPFSFNSLFHFVKISQISIALANSLMVPVIYLLLRELFKKHKSISLVAGGMIALSPFIVGYSRVVHVDALLGSLLFAAVIVTVLYGRTGFSRKWLIASAVFSALAILTKAPAIFMLPYFILVVLVYGWGSWRKKDFIIQRLREFTIWLLLIGILIVIIWPAILWVPNPQGNVLVLKRDIGQAAITPHHMAQDYTLNASYYIYTLLTRTTPVVLALTLIGFIGFITESIWFRKKNINENKELVEFKISQRSMWLLLAFMFFFVVMMMLGAKKGDRYILPVFFAMDTLAAVGVWYLARNISSLTSIHSKFRNWNIKKIYIFISAVVLLYLGGVTYQYHPYAIAYSNPLLPDNLSQELGWGEGLEQVGAWLNVNDPKAVVASWYPEELGAYTSAHVAHINAHEQAKVKYIVLYRNMFGRAPDHYANDFIDEYFKKREPVHVVEIVGKDFAWVYEKRVYSNIVPEIKSGVAVQQIVNVTNTNLTGIELMLATYSGEAIDGNVIVDLRDEKSGKIVQRWKKPVTEINDRGWTKFKRDASFVDPGNYSVVITTESTGPKAPTVRYSPDGEYRDYKMKINGVEKQGNVAVRLLYLIGDQIAKEEDTKLLP